MFQPKPVFAAAAVLAFSATLAQTPLGNSFTYQGELALGGTNVTDLCDFEFELYDAEAAGNKVGTTVPVPNTTVVDGILTVELDFGSNAFNGNARWLEIAVACPAGGGLTTLEPRQKLTAVPYALSARICSADDFLFCYAGSPSTLNVGQCKPGTRQCNSLGTGFESCVGEILPDTEVCDGVDNDCDGSIDESGVCSGEIIITEILYDSSQTPDENGEWFEVYNPSGTALNMKDWVIKDSDGPGQEIFIILTDLIVGAQDFAVLCNIADPSLNGGVICDYEYGFFTLDNTADELIIESSSVLVDSVLYDEAGGWPEATSGSLNLDPSLISTSDNDLPGSWCNSPNGGPEIPNGDEGSPGATNVSCP